VNWAKASYKLVSVKSIRVDMPDIKRRMKASHVEDLARDIRAHGDQPIHAPTVRAKTNDLVCGRDRFAATLVNGSKKLWVHIVECTDDEAKELELTENIYRRADNRAELLARLVQLQKQKIRAEEKEATGNTVAGAGGASRPPKHEKTVTKEARAAVARAAGVSPVAVKRAEERAAAAKAEEAEAPDETEQEGAVVYELPEGFNAFGLIVSQDEIREIENITLVLGDWDKANRRTLGHLTDIEKAGGAALAPTHAQKIRERLQAAGHAIRDAIPASLCYFCKSLDALKAACPACGGTGVVGMHGGDNVPPELKLGEPEARVAVNGKFVLVGAAENAAGAVAAKPSKPARSIKVTQVDGSVADLDNIDDDAQAF